MEFNARSEPYIVTMPDGKKVRKFSMPYFNDNLMFKAVCFAYEIAKNRSTESAISVSSEYYGVYRDQLEDSIAYVEEVRAEIMDLNGVPERPDQPKKRRRPGRVKMASLSAYRKKHSRDPLPL